MKFSAETASLAATIALAARIAARNRHAIPILGHVLIRAADGALDIKATNLDAALSLKCTADVRHAGSVTMEAKQLLAILKSFPSAQAFSSVFFEEDKDQWVALECGTSRLRLAGLHAQDFPQLPDPPRAVIASVAPSGLSAVVRRAAIAGRDKGGSIQLRVGESGGVEAFGFENSRLSRDRVAGSSGPSVPIDMVIEPEGADVLVALLDASTEPVEIRYESPWMFFLSGPRTLALKGAAMSPRNFESYMDKIRKTDGPAIGVNREAFGSALRRIAPVTDTETRPINLRLEPGQIAVSADSDRGTGSDVVPCAYDGKVMDARIQSRYILDFLDVAGAETVKFQHNGPNLPVVLSVPDTDLIYAAQTLVK